VGKKFLGYRPNWKAKYNLRKYKGNRLSSEMKRDIGIYQKVDQGKIVYREPDGFGSILEIRVY
jgi:hypothetical protein